MENKTDSGNGGVIPYGYRDDPALLKSATQIRGLLDAGMPTNIIRDILPCLSGTGDIYLKKLTSETRTRLERERDRIAERIGCLERHRAAIDDYLRAVPPTWGKDAVGDEAGR